MYMKNLNFVFILSSFFLISCGDETSKKKNSTSSEKKSVIVDEEEPEETVSDNTRLLSWAKKTDEWITSREKEDTLQSIVTFTNDYDESWDITIYKNHEGEFYQASLIFSDDDNGLFALSYYFDTNGKLCRLDETEIRKSYWQDEFNKQIYMKDGNPYWVHQHHIYKGEIKLDSSYSKNSLTEDSYPIFYETSQLKSLIK